MSFGGLGTGKHRWSLDVDGSRTVIRAALDAGLFAFDTANIYSDGASEHVVGTVLRELADREDVFIATKVAGRVRPGVNGIGLSRKAILSEIDNSLRRLGVDYVDLYQIHRWDDGTPIEETLEALNDVVRAGKARYLGASNLPAWQLTKALYIARREGWSPFVSVQNHYNLIYREDEREMFGLLADEGIGYLPWSPLARGKLSRPWGQRDTPRSAVDRKADVVYGVGDAEVVNRVVEVATRMGVTPAQVAVAWLLHQSEVTAPIVGVRDVGHLSDAIGAIELQLSSEDREYLAEMYCPRPLSAR